MIEIFKLPAPVKKCFEEKGVDCGSAVLTMKTDFGRDGVYKDVYVLLNEKSLFVLEGGQVVNNRSGGYFEASDFIEFELSEINKLHVELNISNGTLCAEYKGKDTALLCFTNSYKHDANVLERMVNDFKSEGKFDEEKIKNERQEMKFCPKCHNRYPDSERKICPKCMDKIGLTKRLGKFFVRYKGYILLILTTFAMITGLSVLAPFVSNTLLYDEVLKEGGSMYGQVALIVVIIIAVRLLSTIVSIINGIVSAKVAAAVVYDLKKTIFNAIQRLSLGFFTNRQTGGLMTQVNNDANTIYWFFCDGFPYLVTNVFTIVFVMALMLALNPLLTLYTFITIPVFVGLFKVIFKLFDKLYAKSYTRNRSFNSFISDVLTGVRVVKAFSREKDEVNRFEDKNQSATEADLKIGITNSYTFPLLGILMQLGSYVVWGFGGWQIITHQANMSYGILMQFAAYMSLIYGPLGFFADVTGWWAACLNSLHRLFEIDDAVPEVRESESPIRLDNVKGDIQFKNVSFSYEENKKVIDDISFDVPAGSTLGIVGHTGAGKSTLANLLTRLYDAKGGTIYIDGVDLKDIAFSTLRENIAIVSQETYLFRGSILDNIRYACQDATYEEVINAAKIASAHDFIIKYPDGYNTLVGWGHKELSGGERQRVSIARAVLKNPKILILDEATAAMDTQTERSIQNALNELTKNRTTIIIAHRLSTLKDADKLIVIENGKMPESGTAKELLAQKGVYYKLYKLQADALKTIGVEE